MPKYHYISKIQDRLAFSVFNYLELLGLLNFAEYEKKENWVIDGVGFGLLLLPLPFGFAREYLSLTAKKHPAISVNPEVDSASRRPF